MIACLDMYNWPESQFAFDGLWRHCRDVLRHHGVDAPETLSAQGEDLATAARNGDLILGQVCGITFARANQVQPTYCALGAFIAADGDWPHGDWPDGHYTSVLIARDQNATLAGLLNQRFAVNAWGSYSGWYGLRHHLLTQGLTPDRPDHVISGGHRRSVEMVASGKADWAAIDSISWGMLRRFSPEVAAAVQVIGHTATAPGLPLVTSPHTPPAIKALLKQTLTDYLTNAQGQADFAAIGIAGIAEIAAASYAPLRHHAGDC